MFWKFPMLHIQHSVVSDCLFNTQSKVLDADLSMLVNNKKVTLNINALLTSSFEPVLTSPFSIHCLTDIWCVIWSQTRNKET